MPMSYSIYVERHKSLDSLCDSATKRFENANSAWGKAFTDHKTADRNLSRADEETKPERAREPAGHQIADRGLEQRERVWADRAALEKDYPVFDAAQE